MSIRFVQKIDMCLVLFHPEPGGSGCSPVEGVDLGPSLHEETAELESVPCSQLEERAWGVGRSHSVFQKPVIEEDRRF